MSFEERRHRVQYRHYGESSRAWFIQQEHPCPHWSLVPAVPLLSLSHYTQQDYPSLGSAFFRDSGPSLLSFSTRNWSCSSKDQKKDQRWWERGQVHRGWSRHLPAGGTAQMEHFPFLSLAFSAKTTPPQWRGWCGINNLVTSSDKAQHLSL